MWLFLARGTRATSDPRGTSTPMAQTALLHSDSSDALRQLRSTLMAPIALMAPTALIIPIALIALIILIALIALIILIAQIALMVLIAPIALMAPMSLTSNL